MTETDFLSFSVSTITGIGPRRSQFLSRLGIFTVRDLLSYIPFRYEDRSRIRQIHELTPDLSATVSGRITAYRMKRTKGPRVFEAFINDGTALLKAVWFNQPFLAKTLSPGTAVVVTGRAKSERGAWHGPVMENPDYEVISGTDDTRIHAGRIIPVYRLTEGISQKQFRRVMAGLFESGDISIDETLPAEMISRLNLPLLGESIRALHFPPTGTDIDMLNSAQTDYHRRLFLEEFLLFRLGLELKKRLVNRQQGIAFRCVGRLGRQLTGLLPYTLTAAQKKVMQEIRNDMESVRQMHRLLQGDVGSGKTIVAFDAMLRAVECGRQAALMAPTEILAQQHYLGMKRLAVTLGCSIELMSSTIREHERAGRSDIIVGTHALIQERVVLPRLGLAVIDEQHRFGVVQRTLLRQKGANPDVLIMTATPIPRSLALTLYGDLDCSIIDELPPGRKKVATEIVMAEQRDYVYRILSEEIGRGRQAYVVYPSIEESENAWLRSAVRGKEAFEARFPSFRVGLLHGRMSPDERQDVMGAFHAGRIDLLVSTTVIEVGVDVPNATVMIVVHAERFGLAQLHQLRGRVGRGSETSQCLLIAYPPLGDEARQRLEVLARTENGFLIAEEDLRIRGPGDFLGTRQSGIPDFRIADPVRDRALLEAAGAEATALIERDPGLREIPSLRRAVEVFWKGKADLFSTG